MVMLNILQSNRASALWEALSELSSVFGDHSGPRFCLLNVFFTQVSMRMYRLRIKIVLLLLLLVLKGKKFFIRDSFNIRSIKFLVCWVLTLIDGDVVLWPNQYWEGLIFTVVADLVGLGCCFLIELVACLICWISLEVGWWLLGVNWHQADVCSCLVNAEIRNVVVVLNGLP